MYAIRSYYEIIRDQEEVTCIFADEKSVLVERRKQEGPLRAAASSGRVERDYQIVGPIIESREIAEIWSYNFV